MTEKIEKMRITTPLDLQGIILTFLRNIFSTDVVNGLHWNKDPEKQTIAIEVTDKDDQKRLNVRPSIFVSIGTIVFQTASMTAGVVSNKLRVAKVEDKIKTMRQASRETAILQRFPCKLAIYSTKTESYHLAYILTKLMLGFRQALEKESNLEHIDDFSVTPPQFVQNMDGDVYRTEILFNADFIDYESILDLSPLLRTTYIEVKNTNANTGQPILNKEMWVTEYDVLYDDTETE